MKCPNCHYDEMIERKRAYGHFRGPWYEYHCPSCLYTADTDTGKVTCGGYPRKKEEMWDYKKKCPKCKQIIKARTLAG